MSWRGRLAAGLLGLVVGTAVGGVRLHARLVPSLDARLDHLEDWHPPTTVRVLDTHGDELDRFEVVRRAWVDLEALPDTVWQAVVAAEDRRFFDHGGVDLLGIARALVVNLRAGRIEEGGSTLTQQLVKNVLLEPDRSLDRKLHEALLAWRLEQRMSKDRILELYLNLIYLGSGNHGVEAAAQDYFGVSARALDPGQAALLAGLIPAPSAWSPRRSPRTARARRRLVLNAMVEEGMLSVLEGQRHKRPPVDPPRRPEAPSARPVGAAYRTVVRRHLRELMGSERAAREGLTVHTAFDPQVQAVAEAAVARAAEAVERRQGHPGRARIVPPSGVEAFREAAEGLARSPTGAVLAPEPGRCFPAVVLTEEAVAAGPFVFRWSGRARWRRVTEHDTWQPPRALGEVVRYGEIYRVCHTGRQDRVDLAPVEDWVEGAAVVIAHDTGEVVALVGGRDVPLEGFVRATQGLRQPGSGFKPLVYAAGLEAGATQIDPVWDGPLRFTHGPHVWSPRNASGRYVGRTTVRQALAWSLNTVAVRMAVTGGIDRVLGIARGAGIRTPLRRDLTLALGSSEVTALELATATAMFPRGGRAMAPVFVTALQDVTGAVVGRAGDRVTAGGLDLWLPGGEGAQVIKPSTAWQVVDMMRGVVTSGTGRRAWAPGAFRAGKTGTTSGLADAWFVGFDEDHTVAVWIGRDTRHTLGFGEGGGRTAAPAWAQIVDALPDRGGRLLPPPDVVMVPVDGAWLGLEEDEVPADVLPWSPPGPEPLPRFPAPEPPGCEASETPADPR